MGTKIENLIDDINSNALSPEESSMVDSIINDLNNPQQQQQQQDQRRFNIPPHLTEQEKQMLMKQQMHQQQQQQMQQQQQQQQIQQHQMQQQQIQQHQMQQQQQKEMQMREEMKKQMKEELEKEKENDTDGNGLLDNIKELIINNKEIIIVFVLTLLFNIETVHEGMKIKSLSIFYDIETEKSTFLFTLFKTLVVTSIFVLFYYLSK